MNMNEIKTKHEHTYTNSFKVLRAEKGEKTTQYFLGLEKHTGIPYVMSF